MSNKAMLEKAAEKFIKKVKTGMARSVETYRELTEALAAAEEESISECQMQTLAKEDEMKEKIVEIMNDYVENSASDLFPYIDVKDINKIAEKIVGVMNVSKRF